MIKLPICIGAIVGDVKTPQAWITVIAIPTRTDMIDVLPIALANRERSEPPKCLGKKVGPDLRMVWVKPRRE